MWIVRKFPEAWGIYHEESGFARLLLDEEIELLQKEFPKLCDEEIKMLMVDKIETFHTGWQAPEAPPG